MHPPIKSIKYLFNCKIPKVYSPHIYGASRQTTYSLLFTVIHCFVVALRMVDFTLERNICIFDSTFPRISIRKIWYIELNYAIYIEIANQFGNISGI